MIANWVEDLSTGDALIDSQKKELFQRINNLLIACREKKGSDEVESFLQFLKTYATMHFLDEESFLLNHCYPLYREHREEHDAFIHQLIALDAQFVKEGATACVIVNSGRLAMDWVVDHVYRSDRMVAEFAGKLLKRFN